MNCSLGIKYEPSISKIVYDPDKGNLILTVENLLINDATTDPSNYEILIKKESNICEGPDIVEDDPETSQV
jgi:hypothetical protein